MRKIFYPFLSIWAFWAVCSSLIAQPTFQLLETDEQAIESMVALAANGDICQVSDAYNGTSFIQRIIVQRYSATAGLLLSHTLQPPVANGFQLHVIMPTSQGGLIVTGTFAPFFTDTDSVFIARIDAQGQLIWGRAFQFDTDIHQTQGAYETNDGGVIIYGTVESSSVFENSIYLVKIDINGNLIWSRKINSQISGTFQVAGGITEDENGDLWLFGSARLITEGSWLAKLNSVGETQSVSIFGTHDLISAQPRPFYIYRHPNGDQDLFFKGDFSLDGVILLAVRTNSSGQAILVRRYKVAPFSGGIDDIRPDGNGGYLASGDLYPGGDYTKGLFVGLDANLVVSKAVQYGNEFWFLTNGILPAADGGYFVGGMADPDGVIISPGENGLFPWLAKTEANGITDCYSVATSVTHTDTTVVVETYQLNNIAGSALTNVHLTWNLGTIQPDTVVCSSTPLESRIFSMLKVYPNPSTGKFLLDWGNRENQEVIIEVVDLQGKVVLPQQRLKSMRTTIDFAGPSGLYFMLIRVKDQQKILRLVRE